jgi:penicillin amidase
VPADSLAILKLMGVQMAAQLPAEVLRARVALAVPPERLADILPDAPGSGVAALPEYAALFDASATDFAALDPDADGATVFADAARDDPLSPVCPARAGGCI